MSHMFVGLIQHREILLRTFVQICNNTGKAHKHCIILIFICENEVYRQLLNDTNLFSTTLHLNISKIKRRQGNCTYIYIPTQNMSNVYNDDTSRLFWCAHNQCWFSAGQKSISAARRGETGEKVFLP